MPFSQLWVSSLALLCHARSIADPNCDVAADPSLQLLQSRLAWEEERHSAAEPREHYWPHARGTGWTKYGVPEERLRDLNASLAWKWVHPTNLSAFIWGTLIDRDENIIFSSVQGIYKYSPNGTQLWVSELKDANMPVLMGDAIYAMKLNSAVVSSLDLATGRTIWSRKVAQTTGLQGDMMEGHNGVLVTAVDRATPMAPTGTASLRAIGLNASTGMELWSYTPDCGIWNIMALFPDEDTTIIMDLCGGLYRLNLYTGQEVWRRAGTLFSGTDGGSTLGADGSVYTCSNAAGTFEDTQEANTHLGRLRKISVNDGSLIWETVLDNACMNFPSTSPDGKTVILADGANVLNPVMMGMHGKPTEEIEKAWSFEQELLRTKSQLHHYGHDDIPASIMGFDASTGALKWKHDVEPWHGMAFERDEERAYLHALDKHPLGFCGPPHWGSATLDQQGKVYIGRSDGKLYIYDPATDSETTFYTGDGALMAGVHFAPGMMVVPTCSWVYVFRY